MSGADADGYDGMVSIEIGGRRFSLRAKLRGHFEPLDGRYHWWGRLEPEPMLSSLVTAGSTDAVLTTPAGQAHATLGDEDLWGRLRVGGTSTPPFAIMTLADLDSS